ncbi:hypothetical protein [Pollutibacter soli]|uniref:hypothetical protein n=1 Tax=Pollutibacter soli TaxID=3034157 RepID=UPI0030135C04
MRKYTLITNVVIIIAAFAEAQPYIDLVNVYYSYSPGKGINENNSLNRFNHFRSQLNIPLVSKKDSSVFLISPSFEIRTLRAEESSTLIKVQSLFTVLTYTKKFNPTWSLTLGIIPRWNGVSSLLFSKGFQLGGLFYISRRFNPELVLRAGLYYNREFFGNFFIPIIGIEWKINQRSNLFGNLPNSLIYENRITKRVSLGASFRTFPNSYRIEPTGPQNTLDYYRITDIQAGAFADFYLHQS